MADRDVQSMSITRSTLLVVTGVGVGLLTLSYVLGVQVGKQSAALRKASPSGSGEELQSLPVPLAEQLRQLEALGSGKPATPPQAIPPAQATSPAVAPAPPAPDTKAPAKPEPPVPDPAKAASPKEGGKWTVQLVATKDAAEAKRVAARATSAGFAARVVTEGGLHKVRLSKQGPKEGADKLAERIKAHGFRAQPTKVD